MSQVEAREWLAQTIADLNIDGVQVYKYAVESPSVPCVMIADSEPVVEVRSVGNALAHLNVRLVCLVPMVDSESSQQMLELLTDLLLAGLPRDRVQFSVVGSTATMELGEYNYYSRDIPVSLKFTYGE